MAIYDSLNFLKYILIIYLYGFFVNRYFKKAPTILKSDGGR